ncbi:MAG: YraN family protein [Chloroflexi bacterium]|nr:YraN family protein [Chloroflexota bacterium]
MTTRRQRTGELGEELASRRLRDAGYRILERKHRTPHGEIDLVCERDGTVVFVEVRTRRPSGFGSPEESITPEKAAHMSDSAQHYIQSACVEYHDWRIDLVAIELAHNGRLLRYEVIENVVEHQ